MPGALDRPLRERERGGLLPPQAPSKAKQRERERDRERERGGERERSGIPQSRPLNEQMGGRAGHVPEGRETTPKPGRKKEKEIERRKERKGGSREGGRGGREGCSGGGCRRNLGQLLRAVLDP